MVSDSTTTAFITSAPNSTNKNFSKKKRINRSAKLKQCKFDARREQWLSQVAVKNKYCKDGGDDVHESPIPARKESNHSFEKLELARPRAEENVGSIHDSDLESLSNSPTSFCSSVLCGNDSGTNCIGTSSSSSSVGFCSGNVSEEEQCDDDGCLDDWEAMADALAADDKNQNQNQCSESPPSHQPIAQMVSSCESSSRSVSGNGNWKSESATIVPRPPRSNCRAWRPDDTSRPQSLPTLSKQYSLPNPERHFSGGVAWACCKPAMVTPSSCPICFEDLDLTDSSFLPCFCGFRLCLFCHKRIVEEDGRCPGCRKPYEQHPVETEASVHGGSLIFRLARSCSMIERS